MPSCTSVHTSPTVNKNDASEHMVYLYNWYFFSDEGLVEGVPDNPNSVPTPFLWYALHASYMFPPQLTVVQLL